MQATVEALRRIMFNNTANLPHPLIQSSYISLWANVDIHCTMNYILSAYCTGFDEVAVVTLLKQLTVFSGADGTFVGIIKAIWDELFHHEDFVEDVLGYASRNVASYSLQTSAVHHVDYDEGILATLNKLFNDSFKAKQEITSATHNCIVRRLEKIPPELFKRRHRRIIAKIWGQVRPRLQHKQVANNF